MQFREIKGFLEVILGAEAEGLNGDMLSAYSGQKDNRNGRELSFNSAEFLQAVSCPAPAVQQYKIRTKLFNGFNKTVEITDIDRVGRIGKSFKDIPGLNV